MENLEGTNMNDFYKSIEPHFEKILEVIPPRNNLKELSDPEKKSMGKYRTKSKYKYNYEKAKIYALLENRWMGMCQSIKPLYGPSNEVQKFAQYGLLTRRERFKNSLPKDCINEYGKILWNSEQLKEFACNYYR